jgi:hypothetical protein
MNRWQHLIRLSIFAALALLLLAGANLSQNRLNAIRTTAALTETTPLENAPPLMAFTTIALGGFRGLIADYLWLRANKLQDDGNYFEMFQLASWIVKLQPRFTGATAFLAWNMAYNISVTFNSFEDRWRWVKRGLELIRDEALIYNPRDPELFKELSWIYLHKLGQDMDDANRYYKTQFARDLTSILGDPQPSWEELAAAPRNPAEVTADQGQPAVAKRIAEAGFTLADMERDFRAADGTLPAPLLASLSPDEQRRLVICLRARWLLDVYKLAPATVLALNRRYGPLDWRLPQTHAIYWATQGIDAAPKGQDLGCERIVFQGLNAAFKTGRLLYLKDLETLETTPNLGLFKATNQAYLDSMARHADNSSIRGGYENFLIDSIVIFYTFGQYRQAADLQKQARAMFPGPKFAGPLDEFALTQLAEDMGMATNAQAQAAIQGYIMQSCYALALNDPDRATAFEEIAQKLWRKYMGNIGNSTLERRGLPPYANMKRNTVALCLTRFPPGLAARLRVHLGAEFANVGKEPPPAPTAAPTPLLGPHATPPEPPAPAVGPRR